MMLGRRLLATLCLLVVPTAASATFQYLGNGYCTSTAGARPDTFMCDASGDAAAAVCDVGLGGRPCAAICEATEGCTGFMVQDNTMYGAGLSAVCQIVSMGSPPKPPEDWGYGWKMAKWTHMPGAGTDIDAHDTEQRDSCFKRVESCQAGLSECAGVVAGAAVTTKFAPPAAPCCIGALPSSWGTTFLLVLALALGCYIGGGVAMGWGSSGAGRLQAHLHYRHWETAAGLVADGVLFAKRGASGGGRGSQTIGYVQDTSSIEPLPPPKKQSSRSSKKKKPKEKEKQKGDSRSNSSGDSGSNAPKTQTGAPGKEWQPTRTGLLAAGARETGVKVNL